MKVTSNQTYIFITILCALLVALVFHATGYIANQGFNPSDDGVILAQAFRILHGEIPHRDFLTIRPALSGYLHTINFWGIIPMVECSRIITISEIFLAAFIWTWLLCRIFNLGKPFFLYPCLGIIALIMGLNTIIIFSWTTLDAIFFSVLGFALSIAAIKTGISDRRRLRLLAAGLACSCIAAFSRQVFAVIVLANLALSVYLLLKACRVRLLPAVMLIGFSPAIAYLGMIFLTGSWALFYQQMTGRTELYQTGVSAYARSLYLTGWVHLAVVCFVVIAQAWQRWGFRDCRQGEDRSGRFDQYWKIAIGGYTAYAIALLFLMAIIGGHPKLGFEIFWCLGVIVIISVPRLQWTPEQVAITLFALLLSWTSSISFGLNSPVFCAGLIATTIFTLVITHTLKWYPSLTHGSRAIALYTAFAIVSVALALLGTWKQLEINYRDLPGNKLHYNLGQLLPGFGGIKTNSRTYGYYRELVELFQKNPEMKDNLVVVPNNAIIYPLLDTRNPFPLDWLQQEEFIGSEAEVVAQIERVLQTRKTYLLIEKFNSKLFAEGLFPLNHDQRKYPYLDLLFKKCRVFTDEGFYFTCLVSDPTTKSSSQDSAAQPADNQD